jgi:alanine racemase
MMTVDISNIQAERGDEVLLWGEGLSADEVATSANTISYELFCQATARANRIII